MTFGLHCSTLGCIFRRGLGLGLALFHVGCERVCGWYLRLVGGGWFILELCALNSLREIAAGD